MEGDPNWETLRRLVNGGRAFKAPVPCLRKPAASTPRVALPEVTEEGDAMTAAVQLGVLNVHERGELVDVPLNCSFGPFPHHTLAMFEVVMAAKTVESHGRAVLEEAIEFGGKPGAFLINRKHRYHGYSLLHIAASRGLQWAVDVIAPKLTDDQLKSLGGKRTSDRHVLGGDSALEMATEAGHTRAARRIAEEFLARRWRTWLPDLIYEFWRRLRLAYRYIFWKPTITGRGPDGRVHYYFSPLQREIPKVLPLKIKSDDVDIRDGVLTGGPHYAPSGSPRFFNGQEEAQDFEDEGDTAYKEGEYTWARRNWWKAEKIASGAMSKTGSWVVETLTLRLKLVACLMKDNCPTSAESVLRNKVLPLDPASAWGALSMMFVCWLQIPRGHRKLVEAKGWAEIATSQAQARVNEIFAVLRRQDGDYARGRPACFFSSDDPGLAAAEAELEAAMEARSALGDLYIRSLLCGHSGPQLSKWALDSSRAGSSLEQFSDACRPQVFTAPVHYGH